MSCDTDDARDLIGQLEEVSVSEFDRYTKFEVSGRTFGYLWEPTSTVGLKQTIAEQEALVAERPQVFEVQFTRVASAGSSSTSPASSAMNWPSWSSRHGASRHPRVSWSSAASACRTDRGPRTRSSSPTHVS